MRAARQRGCASRGLAARRSQCAERRVCELLERGLALARLDPEPAPDAASFHLLVVALEQVAKLDGRGRDARRDARGSGGYHDREVLCRELVERPPEDESTLAIG